MKSVLAAAMAGVLLSGCSAAVREGPEVAMPAAWQDDISVERVVATGRWSVVRPAFPQGLGSDLNEAMRGCAGGGSRPLQVRLHVDRNNGPEVLSGRVEIIDSRTNTVLSHFPVAASGRDATRQFAGEICRKGFRRDWG